MIPPARISARYLTPDQFAERFGPTEEDYQAVKNFAASNGLRVTGTHPNRTLVDVNGTVGDIQKALHLHLRLYRHPVENRTFFAPDVEPSLDLAVPVLRIGGLDSYVVPHPLLTRGKVDPLRPRLGSGTGGTYIGKDFRAAYVPGTTLTGAGQTVGLWEADGYDLSDITLYESEAGLPNVTLTNVLIDSASGSAGPASDEVSLDIEMAISMAPGLSRVIVYEGPNENNITVPYDILNRMATDDLANQLSCSWGFTINASFEQIFQEYGTHGQSFFLASGDSGAYTANGNPISQSPPSDDPNITVVGATTLSTSGPGRLGVGNGVELVHDRGRERGEQRRDQHDVFDSELAGAGEHGVEPRVNELPESAGRGDGGGQHLGDLRRRDQRGFWGDELRGAAVGGVYGAGQRTRVEQYAGAGWVFESGALRHRFGEQLRCGIS